MLCRACWWRAVHAGPQKGRAHGRQLQLPRLGRRAAGRSCTGSPAGQSPLGSRHRHCPRWPQRPEEARGSCPLGTCAQGPCPPHHTSREAGQALPCVLPFTAGQMLIEIIASNSLGEAIRVCPGSDLQIMTPSEIFSLLQSSYQVH